MNWFSHLFHLNQSRSFLINMLAVKEPECCEHLRHYSPHSVAIRSVALKENNFSFLTTFTERFKHTVLYCRRKQILEAAGSFLHV